MVLSVQELSQLWKEKSASLALLARAIGDWHEDSVQEAFLKLAAQEPPPNDPAAWLFQVVRNQAISYRRSDRRRSEREFKSAQQRSNWFADPKETETRIDSVAATAALQGLAEEEREVVILHLWGELSFRQIAEVLGISAATVHRRYQSSLTLLRTRLRVETH